MRVMIRRFLSLSFVLLAACSPQPTAAQPAVSASPTAGVTALALPDFVSLVRREGATVVNISTTRTVRGLEIEPGSPWLAPEDPLYEFFRRFFGPGPPEYQARSLGSGFIISEDGYILTNAHVVAEMDEAMVKLVDKREFKAKVVGVDRRTDVALVKIDAAGLRKVTIGDPSRLEVGEWVAAIGSPFGFENRPQQCAARGDRYPFPPADRVARVRASTGVRQACPRDPYICDSIDGDQRVGRREG